MADNYLTSAANTVPSPRQLKWMDLEFYAFIHFGINTFTGNEWETGRESPDVFAPESFDPNQWCRAVKLAGMKGLILTCKHHDGFCLWPSKYTDYTVANSKWLDGEGDVVRSVSASCRKYGLAFGVYLSPWDRHEETYGTGKAYDDFYKNQLSELLTDYGDIFCVWLDGACGEGKHGRKQDYNWDEYYALIRELQPDCCIVNCGPDARWCGNESGVGRLSEWSVLPSYFNKFGSSVKTNGVNFTEPDLGSRSKIKNCDSFIWYPSEVDVSIRKNWFYRSDDDYTIKPLSKLVEIYNNSVGANASLLLNIPPQPDGLLNEKDVDALLTLGAVLQLHFEDDLALDSKMSGDRYLDDLHSPTRALPDKAGYWHSGDDPEGAELILDLGDDYDVDRVVLKENVETGQQIERFELYVEVNNKFKRIYKGTVIGHKRIIEFDKTIRTQRLKLVIKKSRLFATIKSFEAY